jgi:TrmH family RNA methyltransferase
VTGAALKTIRSANAEFQLLEALLGNRKKRKQRGEFLIHGVRPIETAIAAGWPLSALLVNGSATSRWARDLLERAPADEVIRVEGPLLDRLSDRADGAEVVAVGKMHDRDIASLPRDAVEPIVVAEAVQSPGNLGTILRSARALGAAGVISTGHAADLYDPQSVRASTGALFTVPFATAASVKDAMAAIPVRTVGLHPDGDVIDHVDLAGPLLLVAGTESTGLSRRALESCDALASIPMTEPAGSLNVSTAVAVALAEAARRRRARG